MRIVFKSQCPSPKLLAATIGALNVVVGIRVNSFDFGDLLGVELEHRVQQPLEWHPF